MAPDPAEVIELALAHAANEGVPLVRGESENWSFAITAVPDADRASGQVTDFDTITVREAQRTLDPGGAGHRNAGQTSRH